MTATFSPDRPKTARNLFEESYSRLLQRVRAAREAKERFAADPSAPVDEWSEEQIRWLNAFDADIGRVQDVYEAASSVETKYVVAAREVADKLVQAYDEAHASLSAVTA